MNRILIALALVLSAAVAVPAVAHQGKGKSKGKRPEVIALPTRLRRPRASPRPSGTRSSSARATTGEIYKGSLRSGAGDTLVEGGGGKQATGLKVDRYRPALRLGRRQQGHPRLRPPARARCIR